MSEMVFYTNPMSRGRTVRWMLEEIGQPYRSEIIEFGAGMHAPTYLAINPMGKVPALVHGDKVVTEAAAICCYLAETFPEAGLMPQNRAGFYRWMFFAAGPVEQAVVNSGFGWVPSTPQDQGRTGYGSLDRVLDTLRAHLSTHDYMVDGAFSVVDLYLGSLLGWGMMTGAVPKDEIFGSYAQRLRARPAAGRAAQMDDAMIKRG